MGAGLTDHVWSMEESVALIGAESSGSGVKRRIIIWASTGLLVAGCWSLYAFATAPDYEIPMTLTERFVWTLACITCPIVLAGVYFYWVLIANAATYALVGLIVETLRRKLNPAK
jgi:uncharacterized RDD family membrane protein YckC